MPQFPWCPEAPGGGGRVGISARKIPTSPSDPQRILILQNRRTMVFGALRLYYVVIVDFADITISQIPVIIMTTVECGVAIMVSSCPLLKPAFDAILRRIFALFGLNYSEKHSSGATPIQAGTLVTFGGGHIGSRPSHLKWGVNNRSMFSRMQDEADVGIVDDLEMGGFREHQHKVVSAAVACLDNGQDTTSYRNDTVYKSDDGVTVTSKAIATINQEE